MSDRPADDPSTPPPAPWWSTPSGSWGAPTPDPAARPYGAPEQPTLVEPQQQPQPPYGGTGQPAYGEAGYGEPGYGRPEVLQQDGRTTPWAFPPGSYREPVPAHDTLGRTEAPARRRGLAVAGAVLATALVAGGVGGVVGSQASGSGGLLDPSASLGGSSTAAPAVERPDGTVAAIAAEVLKSTVSIGVDVQGGGSGTGSGVVVRSDGYVLTNNHVVEAAKGTNAQITVTVNSTGERRSAQIVGLDPDTDLAVLKVEGGQVVPATLGQSRNLVVGDPVIAIGSPLGLAGSVTTGIVSALNRTPQVPAETGGATVLSNAIQTDAAINPGNSGGALVDSRGEVVGINSAIATLGGSGGASGSIGIGFAIPIDEARSIAEEIIRTGKVTHPAIGVTAATVAGQGARISEVAPGSSAERAGLRGGDLITKVGDDPVTSVDELILAIRGHDVGDEVEITYTRDGDRRTAQATLQDKRTR